MSGSEQESCALRGRTLPGAAKLEPYQQGELDFLCGLYTAINGLRLALATVSPLDRGQCLRLFRRGMAYLNERSRLPSCRRSGLTVGLWHQLVGELASRASIMAAVTVHPCSPFYRRRSVTLDHVFAFTEAMLDQGSPVLLRLEATQRHFSVIAGYTPTRLRLFDSSSQHWLNRKSCSTARDAETLYRIPAGSLIALRL
jgi:hypothetical protein